MLAGRPGSCGQLKDRQMVQAGRGGTLAARGQPQRRRLQVRAALQQCRGQAGRDLQRELRQTLGRFQGAGRVAAEQDLQFTAQLIQLALTAGFDTFGICQ